MNNELEKIIKEELDKVVEKILDDEIEEGKELRDICNNYKKLNINCLENGYIKKVSNYVERIERKYSILVGIYVSARSNGNKVNNENIKKCHLLPNCIDFLECLKKDKEHINNLEKVKEIIKGTFKE